MKNKSTPIFFLDDRLVFPPVEHASPNGLLAVGGDLTSERLLLAYQSGIFPWFNDDSLILWWSPDPRMVLFPEKVKISKSMRRILQKGYFRITKNKEFEAVIRHCAEAPRPEQDGTWITENMIQAYLGLNRKGIAHSFEVWENEELVGGLYGIDLGHIFCGESMFSIRSNASKFAFIKLAEELQEKNYFLIDCQNYTKHLESLGAEQIPRAEYLKLLKR